EAKSPAGTMDQVSPLPTSLALEITCLVDRTACSSSEPHEVAASANWPRADPGQKRVLGEWIARLGLDLGWPVTEGWAKRRNKRAFTPVFAGYAPRAHHLWVPRVMPLIGARGGLFEFVNRGTTT